MESCAASYEPPGSVLCCYVFRRQSTRFGFYNTEIMGRVWIIALLPAWSSGQGATFYRDVLPILRARCRECHRPGGSAPMAFETYEQVRPWAKAIRDAVATRKMPPWFADPCCGHFSNDRSLSQSEIETFRKWVDDKEAQGDPRDRKSVV